MPEMLCLWAGEAEEAQDTWEGFTHTLTASLQRWIIKEQMSPW